MPTYEYECAKCGKTFEVFQSMKDEPLKTCPDKKCKGKVKRLLGTGSRADFQGQRILHHRLSERGIQSRGEEGVVFVRPCIAR